MNWKDIPIPNLMKDLVIDPRGFPTPYIVLIDNKGVSHFKVNDDIKTEKCINDKLCTICGNELHLGESWFIGGTLSTFHPSGVFNDAPIHKECGEYSLKVCPYMAYSQYKSKPIDTDKIAEKQPMIYINPTMDDSRLDFFCFVKSKLYQINRYGMQRTIKPLKPYLEIEFWLDGNKLYFADALQILVTKEKYQHLSLIQDYYLKNK